MKPRYDVFLSHSSADKPAVEKLALKLRASGIEPFLDKWYLIPGRLWQSELEKGLRNSNACIIFVGSEGIGPWHRQEMLVALDRGAREPDFSVITVLLPGFRKPTDIPDSLAQRTWVEFFSLDDEDAFHSLISGIQGKSPGPGRGEPGQRSLPYRCMAQPPDEWVHRREYDEVLEALCPKDGIQAGRSVGITTALRGAGGFGKTALAQKLCFDERVRGAYPDGILWTTMGEDLTEAGRLSRIRDLIRGWTEKEAPAFETVDGAAAELRKLLAGRRVILVIDDAWSSLDINSFKGLEAGSALLITTRVEHVLPEKSTSFPVDTMESSEALALLSLGLLNNGHPSKEIQRLADRLGEWALLLRLVNGFLKDLVKYGLSAQEAIQQAYEDLDTEGFSAFNRRDQGSRNSAVSKTISISLKRLVEKDRNHYFRLAIFPEDEDIPFSILERYWELSRSATRRLCEQLSGLSLLRKFDLKKSSIRLHDVMRRFLIEQRTVELPALNQNFLRRFRPTSGKWQDLSEEETYLWKRLAYHLREAEENETLRKLLVTFSFLEAKLIATDVNALLADYEHLVGESQELRLIRDALRLSAHVLSKDRKQLAPQLLGRLLDRKEPGVNSILEGAKVWSGSSWLRPRTGSLTQAGGALIRTFEGHAASFMAVAVVDGRRAVSGSYDGTLRVWDLESGQTLNTLEGHTDRVQAVVVVDGRLIVSASDDETLRVWDLESGQPLKTLKGHWGSVQTVAVVDDWRVISGSYDKTLRVWDLESGQTLKILEGHTAWVRAVAVVDGQRVVSASSDGTIRVWDLESGQTLNTLKGHTREVNAVALVDGRHAISASDDRTLRVWDIESGRTLQTLEGHTAGVSAVVVDGQRAVSTDFHGILRVWDLENGQTLKTFKGHTEWARAVALVDSRRAISASDDRTLRVWNLESDQAVNIFEGHADVVQAVAVVNNRRAISASDDGTLRVWNLQSGQTLKTFKGHTAGVNAVAVIGSRRAVSASDDGTLRVWDLESGQTLKILEGQMDRVSKVVVVDSRRVISADGAIQVWDLERGKILKYLKGCSDWSNSMAVVDGQRAISTNVHGTLRVWDLESGQTLKTLEGHTDRVNAVAMVGGRRVISGSDDRTLQVWDLESGQTLKILEGHTHWVTAVAVVDGRCAVSASYDRTLRVWDLESGESLAVMTLDAPAMAVAATPDGKIIIAGDQSGKVHFFDLVGSE